MESRGSSIPWSQLQQIADASGWSHEGVIIEGSKPGYVKNTLIQGDMERGSAVGTAGSKLEMTSEDSEYVGDESHKNRDKICSMWQTTVRITKEARFTVHFEGTWTGLGQINKGPLQVDEALHEIHMRM
eukprot:1799064-Amphidinium_carterae.1